MHVTSFFSSGLKIKRNSDKVQLYTLSESKGGRIRQEGV